MHMISLIMCTDILIGDFEYTTIECKCYVILADSGYT